VTPPPPVICYSPPFHEVEIAMSRATGRDLADLIARGEGEMAGDLTADPAPYPQLLDAVRVTREPAGPSGKVVLGTDADRRVLTITGALEHLAVLADIVRSLAASPDLDPKSHLHIEYYDEHPYLAESEVALVLRIVL
jgi:hypothetical protein